MGAERYVVLGLAQARSSWFRSMAQWANSGTIPAEFVKCVSGEEMRARLASGRPFSALLIDAALPALDRDLVDAARAVGCVTIAVDDRRGTSDWDALGVAAVLPDFFDPKALLDILTTSAIMIGRGDALPGDTAPTADAPWRGKVVTVCGPGGTGTSTVAVAVAQGLADDPRHGRSVLLADLALHAEQAMLHDARDVVPGVQELVEAHRSRRVPPEEVRALTFEVHERGYQLLLGLRQARSWTTIRPRAFEAAFESLRRAYRVVVCDADADLEGEEEGGSIEVEERNVMSRTAALRADVVFAVGLPGMKGLHSLVRVLNELRTVGVAPGRVVPVVNRAPKGGRARSEITSTLGALTLAGGAAFAPPVFLPDRRVEEPLLDGIRLSSTLALPLRGAFTAVVDHVPDAPEASAGEAQLVRPGSLGSWSGDDDDDADDEAALG
ncbi:MAG: AAA family ATPase [Acidimicrobiales bacterium]